jgi:ABC-type branched-subunit amino acid transport system substrate-binding protein
MKRILLAALLLVSCVTPQPAQQPGTAAARVPDAEADMFRKARLLHDAGRYDEAAKAYADFLQQYPQSSLADEAMVRRGVALEKAGQLKAAETELSAFLEKHPTSAWKNAAAVELATVQEQLGKKPRTGAQMSETERQEAISSLSQTWAQSGHGTEELRAAVRAVEASPAAMPQLLAALDAAPSQDVAQLVAELDKRSPAWPPAALKLARVQWHAGDHAHATDLASDILRVTGGTGDFAAGARVIEDRTRAPAEVKPGLIGIVLPLSGSYKAFADQALNAIALTLDLQGRGNVRVSIKDSKGEPDTAADAVEELWREGAVAILGPLALEEGYAAATRAQQLGIPMISLSRAESLTQIGEWIFRDMPPASAQAKAVADYAAKKLGAKAFGVLQPDSQYGDDMSRYFWDAVEAEGGEVRAYEHYPMRTTTFKPFVQRMVGRSPQDLAARKEFADEAEKIASEIKDPYRKRKALSQLRNQQAPVVDFDAIFIPDGARTIRLIAPAIAAEDVITTGCDTKELEVVKRTTKNEQLRTVQLLGTSLWDSPDIVDERSGIARYVQCSIFVDSFFAQSERPATRKFVDEFAQAYQHPPGFLEAHAYDAASILRRAIDTARPDTREALRNALASARVFEGAAGDTKFGKDREAQKPFFWLWINRGTIVEFDPDGSPPVPPAAPSASR